MNNCTMCGIEIPESQNVCSVCYGDPHYGTDGYLLQIMEYDNQRQMEEYYEREREIEREEE